MSKVSKLALVACMASLLIVGMAWAGEASGAASPLIKAPNFTPAPENRTCHGHCGGSHSTAINGGPSDWGMGNSCTEAQTALTNSLYSTSDNQCVNLGLDGVCGTITQVTTTACYFNTMKGMYQIDGYAIHPCAWTICIGP
jgi:hypothetical protein